MLQKNSFCSSETGNSLTSNALKGSLTMDNQKRGSKLTKAFEKTQIQIKNQLLDDLLQVYSWRSKTQLPIAKVMFCKVVSKNPTQNFTTVQVSYESFPMSLSDLKQIGIQNLLYLLRQAVIGYQRLFNVFGSFLISNKMIGLNKNNRCKVWINQNFSINQPIDVQMFKGLSQNKFINQILNIFQKKAEKSKKCESLFNELIQCQKFQQLVNKINQFSKMIGLQIGNSLKIQQKTQKNQRQQRKNQVSKSPIRNINQMTSNSFINTQNKQLPRFLNKGLLNEGSTQYLNKSTIGEIKQKSRSISRSNIRNKSPLTQNRSQINLHNPLKALKKNSGDIMNHSQLNQKSNQLDYSFEIKKNSSSPIDHNKSKVLVTSTNSLSNQSIGGSYEEKFKFSQINNNQPKDVMKSDLNTAYTSNSSISVKFKNMVQKKASLFDDEQRNMLQSIVAGQQPVRKGVHRTFDLQKLGKLGKHIGQSCMPQDFEN